MKSISIKELIRWLQAVLGLLVLGIVIENAHIFALIQGTSVNLALIVCALIIGLKVQMRVNNE